MAEFGLQAAGNAMQMVPVQMVQQPATVAAPASGGRPGGGGGPSNQICRTYAATGKCSYGDSCRFKHERESRSRGQNDSDDDDDE